MCQASHEAHNDRGAALDSTPQLSGGHAGAAASGASAQRVKLSKALSACLRHRGPRSMRPDGFAPLPDVCRSVGASAERILELCRPLPGEKVRFELREEGVGCWIRATHGHSDRRVHDAAAHQQIFQPLGVLVHGTHANCVASILQAGLKSMGRKHVHFVDSDSDADILQGFRAGCDSLVYVDMADAMLCGLDFFRTPDGMIVSPGVNGVVPPRCIIGVQPWSASGSAARVPASDAFVPTPQPGGHRQILFQV